MNFIPVLLLALVILCLCGFLGGGLLVFSHFAGEIVSKIRRKGGPSHSGEKAHGLGGADALLTGELILTGLAVTAHVAAVFTGQSFSRCTITFMGILGTALLFAAVLFLFYRLPLPHREGKHGERPPAAHEARKPDPAEKLLMVLFWILVTAQVACLLWDAGMYISGDMTVETVGSFLRTDSIYQVDPMTGQAYMEGIPSRLKMLCLPTLYGIFCKLSGLTPESVVTAAVPVWIFVSSYAAFSCVGKRLFPESRKKRYCFLIIVVILMWAGSSYHSLDGFGLLYCGYRGITIRNLVLIPYLISLCLRKKWGLIPLCILAEACIVWTFYGSGACVLTAAGLFLTERRRRSDRTS